MAAVAGLVFRSAVFDCVGATSVAFAAVTQVPWFVRVYQFTAASTCAADCSSSDDGRPVCAEPAMFGAIDPTPLALAVIAAAGCVACECVAACGRPYAEAWS